MMELPEKTLEILHVPEPLLEFGLGQTCDHPKDGLFLFGPHDGPPATQRVSVGVVGTEAGIELFKTWASGIAKFLPVPPPRKMDKKNRLHLSDFPGLEEAFGISVDPRIVFRKIDSRYPRQHRSKSSSKIAKDDAG